MRESVIHLQSTDDEFSYAQIKDIIVYNNHKLFEVTFLNVISYDSHCQSIQVEAPNSSSNILCLYTQFYCHGVLHLKKKYRISGNFGGWRSIILAIPNKMICGCGPGVEFCKHA